jgi:hypothetical protein
MLQAGLSHHIIIGVTVTVALTFTFPAHADPDTLVLVVVCRNQGIYHVPVACMKTGGNQSTSSVQS